MSTGKIRFTGLTCERLTSWGDTGDITLTAVIARGAVTVERSTGDVTFAGCDAAEIRVETDTGDVEGTLLTEKIFRTATDTGAVNVPATTTGGLCQVTTDTGDIRFRIQK